MPAPKCCVNRPEASRPRRSSEHPARVKHCPLTASPCQAGQHGAHSFRQALTAPVRQAAPGMPSVHIGSCPASCRLTLCGGLRRRNSAQPVDTIRTRPEAITAIRPRGWAPASSGAFPPRNRPRKPSQRLSEAPGATGVSGTPISHPSRIHSPHRLAIDPYRCLQKGCPQLLEARQIRRFTASAHEPPKNLTFRREPVMHDI